MSEKRRGLGRGLGALIPTGPASAAPASPAPAAAPTERESTTTTREPSRPSVVRTGPSSTTDSRDPVTKWIVGSVDQGDVNDGSVHDGNAGEGSVDQGRVLLAPAGAYFAEVPVAAITANPKQPRTVFDEDALDELIHSITQIGLLQPIVVRPLAPGRFELVMGERRWRAHQRAGLEVIPAIVRETADEELLRDALLENLHRSQLNALEEAAAYRQLLDDFGCTHDELAQRIGRSRPQISNTLRLLNLPPSVQRRLAAGVISAGHARALLSLDDAEAQERLANRIVAEGLSVRMVEELVALGETGGATKERRTRARSTSPELAAVADRLADALDTSVQIKAGAKGRGRVVIEFASHDDLQRIVEIVQTRT